MMLCSRAIVVLFALATCSSPLQSAFVVNMSEVGADIQATASGTLNTTALTYIALVIGGNSNSSVNPLDGIVGVGTIGPGNLDGYYNGITGPSTFGPGVGGTAVLSSGDFVVLFQGNDSPVGGPMLVLPPGYNGTALTSQALWQNQSFSSLGIAPGSYTWSWGAGANADSFTLNAISAVPEPSSVALLGLVGVGIGVINKRRRTLNLVRQKIV